MCRTSEPPRRDMYELTTELGTRKVPFLLPESGRRWNYLGPETHYGYAYHIWENALTKARFAWEVTAYRTATKETA